jgi:ribosome assembly protein YihI (activator of Der GTPase)
MKCPDCGTDLHGKDRCSKCGKKIELPQKDVEVEYKEFTLSEFLEIRKKPDVSGGNADTSTPEETKQEKAFNETAPKIPLTAKVPVIKAEQAKKEKMDKKFFPAVMLFLLIAVFIAAAFFLIKFLFRP